MTNDTCTRMVVDRSSIAKTELRTAEIGALAGEHVRVRVDSFALTANTVTYAQFGDVLGYWDFYPVDAHWGLVPAIGWGTVVESNVDGIATGGRCSGWLPMATTVDLRATPTADGFRDDGSHRMAHAPTYRAFAAPERDPLYFDGAEDRLSLLRGLFATGFLIDGFLAVDDYRGAEQVVVLSASSKTALGYAAAAGQAKGRGDRVPALIGVTGAGNVDFVRATRLYDDVITYSDVDSVPQQRSVIIDMAGASDAVAALHRRLGDRCAHSMIVGKSHHDAPPATIDVGPPPEMFFAPTEIERRVAEVGAEAYRAQLAEGLEDFLLDSVRWLDVEHHVGPAAVQAAWERALTGGVPPSVGVIATMSDPA